MRIFREERAVGVGGDAVFVDSPFGTVLAVVTLPFNHSSKRGNSFPEIRPAAVVFKADYSSAVRKFPDHVADTSWLTLPKMFAHHVKHAKSLQLFPVTCHVGTAKKLRRPADEE